MKPAVMRCFHTKDGETGKWWRHNGGCCDWNTLAQQSDWLLHKPKWRHFIVWFNIQWMFLPDAMTNPMTTCHHWTVACENLAELFKRTKAYLHHLSYPWKTKSRLTLPSPFPFCRSSLFVSLHTCGKTARYTIMHYGAAAARVKDWTRVM